MELRRQLVGDLAVAVAVGMDLVQPVTAVSSGIDLRTLQQVAGIHHMERRQFAFEFQQGLGQGVQHAFYDSDPQGFGHLVLLEAPVPADRKIEVPAIPITVTPPPDGTPVLTYGCPAPAIANATVSEEGNLTAIRTILFTHANTGIVAAQYRISPSKDLLFEFSVGWHHGESGGPVLRLEPDVAAFAVMQHYRNIQGPHGTMAGPRRGLALASIREDLRNAGAALV